MVRGGSPSIDFGGVQVPATVELSDAENDIAVLKTSAQISAEPLVLSVQTPPPGAAAFAIGNPRELEKSISAGVVSAVREVSKRQLLQITTPVSPGSSGGPVFDTSGKVIGLTVSSIQEGQNLNFAVPASAVLKLLSGGADGPTDVGSLLEKAENLLQSETYSDDPNSAYQRNQREAKSILSDANRIAAWV